MAELQMKNYEGLRQKEDVMYDEIKTTKEITEMNHLVVKPRNQWLKRFLLILLISVLSAGIASTITYITMCVKLQEKFNILDVKLKAIERQNGTEHRDNRLQTQIDGSSDHAQLKQFTLDLIEKKLSDVERKNKIKEHEMERRYNLTSSSLQKQIDDSTDMVGFTAFGISSGKKSSGHILRFPAIKTSFGLSGLSTFASSGKFTCEKNGLYLVGFTVMSCSSGDSTYDLYKNNILLMPYYVTQDDVCGSGSGTIFIRLNANDALYLKTSRSNMNVYDKWSSFSILKIK